MQRGDDPMPGPSAQEMRSRRWSRVCGYLREMGQRTIRREVFSPPPGHIGRAATRQSACTSSARRPDPEHRRQQASLATASSTLAGGGVAAGKKVEQAMRSQEAQRDRVRS